MMLFSLDILPPEYLHGHVFQSCVLWFEPRRKSLAPMILHKLFASIAIVGHSRGILEIMMYPVCGRGTHEALAFSCSV
ncbi:hypothetical protein CC2G_002528 [Coprinopsis cinerea AmutBmut pab1-1]|nr:hypothetical protein CC2G_002528 [Coprinopsis cinerea AmutBmut pab1-1]